MQLGIISIPRGAGLLVDGNRKVIDIYHNEERADKAGQGISRAINEPKPRDEQSV